MHISLILAPFEIRSLATLLLFEFAATHKASLSITAPLEINN